MKQLQRLVLSSFLVLAGVAGQAQAYIPDPVMRDWLNEVLPGSVDGAGVMDTLHAGIPLLDTVIFSIPGMGNSVDLFGLQFLDALVRFTVSGDADLVAMSFPSTLEDLTISISTGSVTLGTLPESLDRMVVGSNSAGFSLDILAMPDSMGSMLLVELTDLTCASPGYVEYLYISFAIPSTEDISLPAINTSFLSIDYMSTVAYDLSAMTASSVSMPAFGVWSELEWPAGVRSITMDFITGPLPAWPSTLEFLRMGLVEGCLPPFPNGLSTLHFTYETPCIPNWPDSLVSLSSGSSVLITEANATYCSVLNSTCPGSYPGISGRVFVDTDGDGEYDLGEPGLQQASVTVQPNGNTVGCGADGTWEIGVAPGVYVVNAAVNYPYLQSITPATHSADVQVMGSIDVGNDFAVTLTPNIADLRTWLWAVPARPGFDNRLYLTCQNYGTMALDAELTLTFDGDQTWVGSSITPASTTATSATWSFPAMSIGTTTTLTVDLHTAATVPINTPIEHLLVASSPIADETPEDNAAHFSDIVVGSYDPNDKLLSPAKLSPEVVAVGETPIEYTIRFQNTGTYLAERVVILDTLSEDLQWASIRFLDSSHPNHWYVTDGVLHVIHSDINLPDSTSDEAGSHGFVRFSILPNTNLTNGSVIENIAHIVFDFNAPIITPPAVFSVDVLASVAEEAGNAFRIYPNPVHDRLWITLPETHEPVINYTITDLLGKVQASGASTSGGVNVRELASGLYTLKVDHLGEPKSVRFVKE
ncbi:MAG: T9SS type A sorting domain-containing protein [Flavobacteriales bacterium]|jgi:uncharacterized repeat protein (TIGR01451 family)|nr:T9SS type A sorting domain-containing protein [Flavobacteriales bacterium]